MTVIEEIPEWHPKYGLIAEFELMNWGNRGIKRKRKYRLPKIERGWERCGWGLYGFVLVVNEGVNGARLLPVGCGSMGECWRLLKRWGGGRITYGRRIVAEMD